MEEMLTWLRATIEGDKARAEQATAGDWESVVDDHGRGQVDASVWSESIGYYITEKVSSGPRHREDAAHIAIHDPRDTIARCEAELALLDLHEHVETSSLARRLAGGRCQPFGCEVCHEKDQIVWGEGVCATIRLLASGYRHRPGFNPEWVSE